MPLLFYFVHLETEWCVLVSDVSRLALNSARSRRWPWASDPPASVSRVLGLQACINIPDLCNAGYWTQGFVYAKQSLYQLSPVSSSLNDLHTEKSGIPVSPRSLFPTTLGCASLCYWFGSPISLPGQGCLDTSLAFLKFSSHPLRRDPVSSVGQQDPPTPVWDVGNRSWCAFWIFSHFLVQCFWAFFFLLESGCSIY